MSGHWVLREVGYDQPDPAALTALAQDFYVSIYGGPDDTPFTTDEFAAPRGRFLVGYLDGAPVAMGGWRLRRPGDPSWALRPAEIKRMFVVEAVRGRGLASLVLAALESGAAAAGADWLLLETGRPQTSAIALYRRSGYRDVPPFGFYAAEPDVVSLGKRLAADPGGFTA
jgi:GNAT superfamily N-acetyltransferase